MTLDEDWLEDALRRAGDEYLRSNPADLHRARARIHQLRRRRRVKAASGSLVAAAGAVAVAVVAWPGADVGSDRPRPAAPIELPSGSVSIPVGDGPTEVAVGDGAIWVSNGDESTVSRIDPATNEVAFSVPLTGSPGDLAVGAGGEVWVANPELGAVQRIDPVTSSTTPDARIAVAPDATPLDLAIDSFLWVSVIERELVQVDLATGEIVRRIDSVRPVNVAARDGAVFVLEADGTVRGLDPLTGEPNAIELSFDVEGRGDVHLYGGTVWVAEGDGSELYSVDVEAVSSRIRSYSFRGTYVEMVEVDDGILVLSDLGDGTGVLTLIDPDDGGSTELAEIDGTPRDLVRGLDDLWVSAWGADAVVRIPSLP